MKLISKFKIVFPLLMTLLYVQSALAATGNASLTVSATVAPSCTVQGSAIAFGNYTTSQVDQSGNVAVNCSNGTSYVVAVDAGSASGASVDNRKMTGPANATLNYSLFQDAARSKVWGSTTGSNTIAGTGNGNLQNLPVYARVPGGQSTQAGVYSDVVSITLTY